MNAAEAVDVTKIAIVDQLENYEAYVAEFGEELVEKSLKGKLAVKTQTFLIPTLLGQWYALMSDN